MKGAGGGGGCVVVELPVLDPTFDLEKAVCSHGLFMMAPNRWDPTTRTLHRPLRLPSSPSSPAAVRISNPSPPSLRVAVFGRAALADEDRQALLAQVRRMLRMSDENDRVVREFHRLHPASKERGFGRVFRSPTLFEDMVKCILLCNCQWSRTLSMARSLCELQLELNCSTAENFHPKTPEPRELKRKRGNGKKSVLKLETKFVETEAEKAAVSHDTGPSHVQGLQEVPSVPSDGSSNSVLKLEIKFVETEAESRDTGPSHVQDPQEVSSVPSDGSSNSVLKLEIKFVETEAEKAVVSHDTGPSHVQGPQEVSSVPSDGSSNSSQVCDIGVKDAPVPDSQLSRDEPSNNIGDFPTPEELASLDVDFLAKRCKLGYRTQRILSLAQSIVEGKLQLSKLEEVPDWFVSASYDELDKQLSSLCGFGPFTRANVLMCMGFYHKIPSDSETIRHLKQLHARRRCTIHSVEDDLESIYGAYAPFQFLAYWSELWHDYEKRFGKLSEMSSSDYQLITASNMKKKKLRKRS